MKVAGSDSLVLPEIFEDYLEYCQGRLSAHRVVNIRRVLRAFARYLEKNALGLSGLDMKQVDMFLSEFVAGFMPLTQRTYRSHIRGFLGFLHHQAKMIPKDLAPLVVGKRIFSRQIPPNFLRPAQVKKLFESLSLDSASQIRAHAMVHLAYTLGLRPVEISLITLDDITFARSQIHLKNRKRDNPIILPVPDNTLKAIAAYLIGVREKNESRFLFLTLYAPHRKVSASTVSYCIKSAMKDANLPFPAYALRHTYAQNLLESGASLYEIKEMLGHDKLNSSRIYLSVHFKMMRKVLFDEDF
jgi:integrase/recombinase XerD